MDVLGNVIYNSITVKDIRPLTSNNKLLGFDKVLITKSQGKTEWQDISDAIRPYIYSHLLYNGQFFTVIPIDNEITANTAIFISNNIPNTWSNLMIWYFNNNAK